MRSRSERLSNSSGLDSVDIDPLKNGTANILRFLKLILVSTYFKRDKLTHFYGQESHFEDKIQTCPQTSSSGKSAHQAIGPLQRKKDPAKLD